MQCGLHPSLDIKTKGRKGVGQVEGSADNPIAGMVECGRLVWLNEEEYDLISKLRSGGWVAVAVLEKLDHKVKDAHKGGQQ